MNCKKGDLAVVRTTHPFEHLHGKLLECLEFAGMLDQERDVWAIRWIGAPQLCDQGVIVGAGMIADRYLFPIGGLDDVIAERVKEHHGSGT